MWESRLYSPSRPWRGRRRGTGRPVSFCSPPTHPRGAVYWWCSSLSRYRLQKPKKKKHTLWYSEKVTFARFSSQKFKNNFKCNIHTYIFFGRKMWKCRWPAFLTRVRMGCVCMRVLTERADHAVSTLLWATNRFHNVSTCQRLYYVSFRRFI